ncbi:hypothetical protein EI77_01886 [Prosthecobacter fusiformis]|uniref:Lipoprotein n=1 Tax=Prosthecobacter fusiformis TaxID=48464 RepID=A0A4R7S6S7_9BACT|nr:hypothetical protein [Prosthecobacter fusiformis]TDU73416.1 hypothetical protein EI77_01886 [Prosthecobacter fusiformis]
MKSIFKLLATATLALGLSSCLFTEPVFTGGFVMADPEVAGVWMSEDETGDARGREFAVLAPIGQDAFMLNYPVGSKGSSYFEVRPLKVGGKDVWQVKLAATFEDGLPKNDTPTYTLLLVEKAAGDKMQIRPLKTEGEHTVSAAATQKALQDKSPDWDKLFGEAKTFTRLKDR